MVEDNQTQQDDCGEADEAFECKRVQGLLRRERAYSRTMQGVGWGATLRLPHLGTPGHFAQKATPLSLLLWPGLTVRWVQDFRVWKAWLQVGRELHSF